MNVARARRCCRLHPFALKVAALLVTLAWALLATTAARGQTDGERVTRFHAEISVTLEGDLRVVETIEVIAQGQQIRRGIFREFPTAYGKTHKVGFQVEAARRDGSTERYRTEPRANGVAVYIGHPDRELPPGPHVYELAYRADRQLGHFGERDELYWNVTGNGWRLPIEDAAATVSLPAGTSATRVAAWTGVKGSKEQAVEAALAGPRATFRTTRALAAGEGLTIAVTWPAGVVARPSHLRKLSWALRDDEAASGLALGLLVILGHLAISYWLVRAGEPRLEEPVTDSPPGGLSPAALNMVEERGVTNQTFAAAVLSLVAKGHARLVEDGAWLALDRQGAAPGAAPPTSEEKTVLDALFTRGDHVVLTASSAPTVLTAKARLEETLRPLARAHYGQQVGPAMRAMVLLVAVLGLVLGRVAHPGKAAVLIALLLLTAVPTTLWALRLLERLGSRQDEREPGFVAGAVVRILFFGGITAAIGRGLAQVTTPLASALFCAVIAATALVRFSVRRRTPLGRAVHQRTARFRRRLEQGQAETAPELTAAYAMALGLVSAQAFEADESPAIPPANSAMPRRYRRYVWHRGALWTGAESAVVAIEDRLLSAVEAATKQPGGASAFGGSDSSSDSCSSSSSTSSSSSESGSSGGGGGGGGGGGW